MQELMYSRYRIIDILGEGTQAKIYRVKDTFHDSIRALKLFNLSKSEAFSKSINSSLKEFNMISHCAHRNIIRAVDYGIDVRNGPFYTMEYFNGIDLAKYAIDLTEEKWWQLAEEIAYGLSIIHARGYLHGPLLPNDILVNSNEKFIALKILDYGDLEALHNEITNSDVQLNPAIAYCAPEIFTDDHYNQRSDIYSLGVLLYQLITKQSILGLARIDANMPKNIAIDSLARIELKPANMYSQISNELSGFISKMLSKDPAARFESILEILDNVNEWKSKHTIQKNIPFRNYVFCNNFVNRTKEIKSVQEMSEAYAKEGHLLVLVGEDGTGKTALVKGLKSYCQQEGFFTLYCGDKDNIFASFLQMINNTDQNIPLQQLDPDNEYINKEIFYEHLKNALQKLSLQYPRIIIMLEEPENIEKSQKSYIEYLMKRIEELPVFWISTASDGSWFQRVIYPVLAQKSHTEIILKNLNFEDTKELLQTLCPFPDIISNVARKIFEYSGGKPSQIINCFSYMVGTIDSFKSKDEVMNSWEKIVLPDKNLLENKKIDMIDSHTEKILSYAAIIGRTFSKDILTQIVPLHYKNKINEILYGALINNYIHYDTDHDMFIFNSPEIKIRLENEITKKDSLPINQSIADAFAGIEESVNPAIKKNYYKMAAEHYAKAGAYQSAIEFYEKVADLSYALSLWEESYDSYQRILKFYNLLSSKGDSYVNILKRLASLASKLMKFADAVNYYKQILTLLKHDETKIEIIFDFADIYYKKAEYKELLALLTSIKNKNHLSQMHVIKENYCYSKAFAGLNEYDKALDYAATALKELKDTDEAHFHAEVLNHKGMLHLKKNAYDEAELAFQEALKLMKELISPLKASLHLNLAQLYSDKSSYIEAMKHYMQALDVSMGSKDIYHVAYTYHSIARLEHKNGKTLEALRAFKSAIFYSHLTNADTQLKYQYSDLASIHESIGDLDKAIEYYNDSIAIAKLQDDYDMIVMGGAHIANVYLVKGNFNKAQEFLKSSKELAAQHTDLKDQAFIEEIEGMLYLSQKEYFKSLRCYEACAEKFNKLQLVNDSKRILLRLAEASAFAKEAKRAKDYLTQAEELLNNNKHTIDYIYYLKVKALILKMTKRTIEARNYLQQAETLAKALGQSYLLGQIHLELANIYYKRRVMDKSKFHIQEAKDIFEKLTSPFNLKKIQALHERIAKVERPRKRIHTVIPDYVLDYAAELINSIETPLHFYQNVLKNAIDFMEAERGALIIYDENTGDLVIQASFGMNENAMRDVIEIAQLTVSETKKQKLMIFSRSAKDDPDFKERKSIIADEILSLVCIPLQTNGHISGALYMDSKERNDIFSITDRKILKLYTNLISKIIALNTQFNEMRKESAQLKFHLEIKSKYPEIIGNDQKLLEAISKMEKIADKDINVLITGERGTGKELIAHILHFYGKRKKNQFLTINCSAFTELMMESEFFGHETGAFPGAMGKKKGIFEEADSGTVYIEEISYLTPQLQTKLLRTLQYGEIKRIGSNVPLKVDVRIIAAADKKLLALLKESKFRKDLFHRLSMVIIKLPPLRKRTGDIPMLIHYFIEKYNQKYNKHFKGLTGNAMMSLKNYPWPGNVSELENLIEKLVATIDDRTYIEMDSFPKKYLSGAQLEEIAPVSKEGKFKTLKELEKDIILQRLQATKWNILKTADTLGVTRFGLYNKLKRLGIKFEMKRGRKPKDTDNSDE